MRPILRVSAPPTLVVTNARRRGGGSNACAAYQKAVREQKLAAELRNAKRERDSYLASVDKAHAIDAMEERKAKKAAEGKGGAEGVQAAQRKVMRSFKQRGRADDGEDAGDPTEMDLSLLANVFSGGKKRAGSGTL
jgi:hypothetical protein